MTATALIAPAAHPRRAFSNPHRKPMIYPESDGKPMADNTRQFDTVVMIQGGLAALFANRLDVFVAGDLLWYPMEGRLKRAERLAERLRALGIDPDEGD